MVKNNIKINRGFTPSQWVYLVTFGSALGIHSEILKPDGIFSRQG